ncbi:MAG: fumarylacetoacetate hydrolase family protein [Bacteroidales bacterium]|nr:fumarylacetoacetate hydrolase family protein [Bacteroidales bacterium]
MKIICIGRNYADHIKEMNSNIPEKPIFFLKPETSILVKNRPFYYPEFSKEIHYETEIVIKINRLGKHIEEKFAHRYYSEIGLGIDFTARDLQRECKKKGLPWEIAKGFEHSAPLTETFVNKEDLPENISFKLGLNGKTVQKGNTKDMIFSFDKLISYLSKFFTLKIGDLIFTGTPAGVGEVKIGDNLKGYMEDRLMFDFKVK